MPGMSCSKLEEALEILFEQHQKIGFLPENVDENDKKDAITKVADTLSDALTPSHLENHEVRKTLTDCLKMQLNHGQHETMQSQLGNFFNKMFENNLDRNEIKSLLKDKILLQLNQLNQKAAPEKQLKPNEIHQLAEQLSDELTEKYMKSEHSSLAMDPNVVNALCELEGEDEQALKNLYGGINPKFTGGIQVPVLTAIGNLAGIVDLNGDNALSNSFLDIQNRYDTQYDYHNIENTIHGRMKALSSVIDEAFDKSGVYSTEPKPTMPGTKT